MLTAKELSFEYSLGARRVVALLNVSLVLSRGEFLCIVGPSGCGKTTLIRLLAGLLRPTEGVVKVDGNRPEPDAAPIGVVFQHPTLFPWLSIQGNTEFGLTHVRKLSGVRRSAAAIRLLSLVGLADFAKASPSELSGGMLQRASLARALATEPDYLLLDEPFSSLDAVSREEMHNVLLELWHTLGTGILLVTHDIDEAVTLSDRVAIMTARPGRIAREIPIALERPRVSKGVRRDGFELTRNQIASLAQQHFFS